MSSTRILDWLGSAALTIAILSMLFLFLPGLVRADSLTSGADCSCSLLP